jgi:hypothetical protein
MDNMIYTGSKKSLTLEDIEDLTKEEEAQERFKILKNSWDNLR